jgi:hypothetical protein
MRSRTGARNLPRAVRVGGQAIAEPTLSNPAAPALESRRTNFSAGAAREATHRKFFQHLTPRASLA